MRNYKRIFFCWLRPPSVLLPLVRIYNPGLESLRICNPRMGLQIPVNLARDCKSGLT
ncbi:MAG: hypothetical protein JWQ79_3581 [Mucilaginibacter sp.]|nr:hypothetical protein [Mucilaginibacter sp.]